MLPWAVQQVEMFRSEFIYRQVFALAAVGVFYKLLTAWVNMWKPENYYNTEKI